MSRSDADEIIGLQAVAWLASHDELLPVFLGATGASEANFREELRDPGFQSAVLDFILMDDAWIVAFCDAAGLDYQAPAKARMALGGGVPHWT